MAVKSDWKSCNHDWQEKDSNHSYRYFCEKCGMWSYIGKYYKHLPPDAALITGKVKERIACSFP